MKIDRKSVYDKYDGHCAYCGRKIEYKDMQVDHVIPKMLFDYKKEEVIEGKHKDDSENLLCSCRRCNHYKRSNTIESFRELLKEMRRKIIDDSYLGKVAMDYGMITWNGWDGKFYFERCEEKSDIGN